MNGRDLTLGILGTLVVGAEIQRRARRMEEGGEGSAARTQSMGLGLLLVAGAAGAYLLYPRKAQAQVALPASVIDPTVTPRASTAPAARVAPADAVEPVAPVAPVVAPAPAPAPPPVPTPSAGTRTVSAYASATSRYPITLSLPATFSPPLSRTPMRVNSEIFRTSGAAHGGMDFGAAVGDPVYAVEGGTIRYATSDHPTAGISVTIRGAKTGLHTTYAHFQGFSPRIAALFQQGTHIGQTITPGEFLGRVGMTGRTTGPHLHLSMNPYVSPKRGWVDPRDVLPASFFDAPASKRIA